MRSSGRSTKSGGRSGRRSESVVVDASVLFANADRSDADHDVCRDLLRAVPGPIFVPTLILGETAYLLGKRRGPQAEILFLRSLSQGELIVEHPIQPDLARMAELVWRYKDLPLGTADASIVALAERLDVTTIATLDRRDFSVVKPMHVEAFELVP
jgi:predicted nucleic acid-binding protein